MKKLLTTVAALALIASPALANEEAAAPAAAPAAEAAADAAAAPAAVEVKETTLKDGTKVSIEGDAVFVVGADGAKTPAPDAEHELADGTKVTTVAGKIVPAAQ